MESSEGNERTHLKENPMSALVPTEVALHCRTPTKVAREATDVCLQQASLSQHTRGVVSFHHGALLRVREMVALVASVDYGRLRAGDRRSP